MFHLYYIWLLLHIMNNHHWHYTIKSILLHMCNRAQCSPKMPSNLFSIFVWGAFIHNNRTYLSLSEGCWQVAKALESWKFLGLCLLILSLAITNPNRYWSVNIPAKVHLTRVSQVTQWDWPKAILPGTFLDTVPLLTFTTLFHFPTGFLWRCSLIITFIWILTSRFASKEPKLKQSVFLLCKVAQND